jgi:biotin carboxyl carrier protein
VENGWKTSTNRQEATALRFDIFIDGKIYNVELSVGKLITIEIDGKTFQAETKMAGKGLSVHVDKKEFLVRFEGAHISINGHKYTVEIRNLRRGRPSWYIATEEIEDIKAGKPAQKMPSGEGMIHPPMPGRVISIKVKEGDSVRMGSPILVLEAMKMQNEVISNLDGIVREIRVSEGDLVESSDVLVVIGN